MREITLDEITQNQLENESRLLINMLRTRYPRLDLRRGTVLRDLLVDADSAVGAMFEAQADEQRECSSLLSLSRRADAGEAIDEEDVNAILSNFNMKAVEGTKAKGHVRVFVSDSAKHTVLAGVKFFTNDGIYFTVTSDVTASMEPAGDHEEKQYQGVTNYWFLVPVEADVAGANGNLKQGTAMDCDTALADYVSSAAYKTFSGGSDLESLDKTVARIKSSLSVRALTTNVAVESQLRDRYDGTENPIVSVSLCGYGNEAQRRDKHNLFGTAVGGRVDVYVRNFTELPVAQQITKPGKMTAPGSFEIKIGHDEIPGIVSVYSVSDPDTDALSSYIYSASYSGDVSDSWHDFDVTKDYSELANTAWRDLTISVSHVPMTDEIEEAGEKLFRVQVVALPIAKDLQDFVDDGLVRNVGSDFVVRGPMIVNMSVNAVVRHPYSVVFDKDLAVTKICEYVNTTGFVGRITRSEISSILIDMGATSVDLFDENAMLYGYVYDALGVKHEMSGDALDIDLVKTAKGMLTKDTAVFALEPKNVQITKLPTA